MLKKMTKVVVETDKNSELFNSLYKILPIYTILVILLYTKMMLKREKPKKEDLEKNDILTCYLKKNDILTYYLKTNDILTSYAKNNYLEKNDDEITAIKKYHCLT